MRVTVLDREVVWLWAVELGGPHPLICHKSNQRAQVGTLDGHRRKCQRTKAPHANVVQLTVGTMEGCHMLQVSQTSFSIDS